jgi:Alr-MurF fusion protein
MSNIVGIQDDFVIQSVVYDSRKILDASSSVFFALIGDFRDGHAYLSNAYEQGVRVFVVSELRDFSLFPKAQFHQVKNTMSALQLLAKNHREQFSYPVIGITGSVGKTTVKEWLYHLLNGKYSIVRSPKSYNSQLGVALSLLEMSQEHNLALIEAGISHIDEMETLHAMIQPTIGVFTAFGSAHSQNFKSKEEHLWEKVRLFQGCQKVFIQPEIDLKLIKNGEKVTASNLPYFPFKDQASIENGDVVLRVCRYLSLEEQVIQERIKSLPRLALRMETFEGKNNTIIINDAYNADLDALNQSLEFQKSISTNKKRVALIGTEGLDEKQIEKIKENLSCFSLDSFHFLKNKEVPPLEKIKDSVVLIKGTRASQIQRIANLFHLKKHKTRLEINLSAIKHNLAFWRNQLEVKTKLLVMVKASAYGSGSEKMAEFLEKNNVDYLGVAYVDEGVELRKSGIKLPILVMNAEEDSLHDLIQYQLEPSIYSFELLEAFIKKLIDHQMEQFPIHLKFETGMNRLGFEMDEVNKVIDIIQTQPEIKVQSVYSHLADSDNLNDNSFSLQQIERFEHICYRFEQRLAYPFMKHLLNSEGITRFKGAQFDMVRLGIGLYGLSVDLNITKKLQQAIAWKSIVSQIKTVNKGESVGYSRTFVAQKNTTIAIIPVGYADGFKRSLSQGIGTVFIDGHACSTVGNVCMDMIMVDISDTNICKGAEVEIIGDYQNINQLAKQMQTIPYEVLTSFSKRLHRVYIDE